MMKTEQKQEDRELFFDDEQFEYEATTFDEDTGSDLKDYFANPEAESEEDTQQQAAEDLSQMGEEDVVVVNKDELMPEDTAANREILEKAKLCVKELSNLYWDLCETIARIHDNRLYKLIGYTDFKVYVEEEFQFSYGKAFALVRIYKYYTNDLPATLKDKPKLLGEVQDRIKSIGWAKAKKIADGKIINEHNVENVLTQLREDDRGKSISVVELDKFIKSQKEKEMDGLTDSEKEEIIDNSTTQYAQRYTFSYAQKLEVDKAVDLATQIMSETKQNIKKSSALAYVCSDFCDTNTVSKGGKIGIADVMSRLERNLGVNIVVVNPENKNILYGKETAKLL